MRLKVFQENLEFSPLLDEPKDERRTEWDGKSLSSSALLGAKSELGSTFAPIPEGEDDFLQYPVPTLDSMPSASNSNTNLPLDNPSTDHLLAIPERSDTYRARRDPAGGSMRERSDASQLDAAPLLDYEQSLDHAESVPYPPSAYTQPPIGYTPPGLKRMATDASSGSEGTRGDLAWERVSDAGERRYVDPYGTSEPRTGQGYRRQLSPASASEGQLRLDYKAQERENDDWHEKPNHRTYYGRERS